MSELSHSPNLTTSASSNGAIHCGTSPHFWNKENRAVHKRCAKHTDIARAMERKAAAEAGRAEQPIADVYDGCWAFSRFPTATLAPAQFVQRILDGMAWIPSSFGGWGRRTNENWQQAELIALDFDQNVSVADCLGVPFIRDYAMLVHPSASSSSACYKTRVVFRLQTAFRDDLEIYRFAVIGTGKRLGLPEDKCSYKPAQLYYGSTNRIEEPYINLDAVLPDHVIEPLIAVERAEADRKTWAAQEARRAANYQPIDRGDKRAHSKLDRMLTSAADRLARVMSGSDRCLAAFTAGNHVGRYIPLWGLDEDRVEKELLNATEANGSYAKYGEHDMLRHIRNGIAAGKLKPELVELPAARRADEKLRVVRGDQGRSRTRLDYAKQGETKQSPYFHRDGAPRSWLLAVCNAFPRQRNMPHFARLWFEALRCGLINTQDVHYAALFDARTTLNSPLKDGAIRTCMKLVGGLFWNLNWYEKASSETEKNSGGRPTEHFRACTLAEIEAALPRWSEKRIEEARHQERGTTPKITPQMVDALCGDARAAALEIMSDQPMPSEQARTSSWLAKKHTSELGRSLKDLTPTAIPLDCPDVRAALFAEEITPDEQRSYTEIKRTYGVGKGTVAKLIKRAGLQAIAQTVNCRVTSVQTFDCEVYEARKREKGYPVALDEITPTGDRVRHEFQSADPQGNREVVEAAHQRGSSVEVVMRTANKYRPADPMQVAASPATVARRRTVAFHEPSEIRPYYGLGYNPTVVLVWLKTILRRMGWRTSERGLWINPTSGVKFDLREMDLLSFAESLGASLQVLA